MPKQGSNAFIPSLSWSLKLVRMKSGIHGTPYPTFQSFSLLKFSPTAALE